MYFGVPLLSIDQFSMKGERRPCRYILKSVVEPMIVGCDEKLDSQSISAALSKENGMFFYYGLETKVSRKVAW